jgi:hypothetical protein
MVLGGMGSAIPAGTIEPLHDGLDRLCWHNQVRFAMASLVNAEAVPAESPVSVLLALTASYFVIAEDIADEKYLFLALFHFDSSPNPHERIVRDTRYAERKPQAPQGCIFSARRKAEELHTLSAL